MPGTRTRPDLLDPNRADSFHELFPPIIVELAEIEHLRELVADPSALMIDGRLVVTTQTIGGADPGGFRA